jgi:hypothetical protein
MMIRFAVLLGLATLGRADILLENDLIVPEEIFDLKYAIDSDSDWMAPNVTKFYCVFRSLWTPEDHPVDFPDLARWSNPIIFSHAKEFTPFVKNRKANYGVEIIAEVRTLPDICTYNCRCLTPSFLNSMDMIITLERLHG